MIQNDYHMHTKYSSDSDADMELMVQAAIGKSLKEIVITDHVDFSYPGQNILEPFGFTEYRQSIINMKEKYQDKINILVGIELGIRPDLGEVAERLTRECTFDFVIGSMHDFEGVDFYFADFYKTRTKKQAYTQYFEALLETVKSVGVFNVFGHLDYIERYGRYEDKSLYYKDYKEAIDEVLKRIVANGKGIELNTSGYRYGLGHPHPQIGILKRYRELGGEIITVGSDAHKPEDVGAYFDTAFEVLQEAGFRHTSIFRDGKAVAVDLS